MPVYQTADQLYTVMEQAFQRMATDPQALTDFQRRRMAVLLQTTDPETSTLINGRAKPVQVTYRAAADHADLSLSMSADLLHDILLERASVKASFMSGAVEVTGNIFRALQLADLFHQIQRVYPQTLQDLGRDG